MKAKTGAVLLVLIAAVGVVMVYFSQYNLVQNFSPEKEISSAIEKVSVSEEVVPHKAETYLVAVGNDGEGKLTKLTVEAVPGNGQTLANIDNLLFFVDTQQSIQTARDVAVNFTGADISKYNLIYDIDVKGDGTTAIEGPSAGAALAIATIAAIEDRQINPEVMITGTIKPDGSIGKVGGVAAKSEAAKEGGAKVLLVPEGQDIRESYEVERDCDSIGRFTICRTNYVEVPTLNTDDNGIIVKEVPNIDEAIKYFVS